MVKTIFFAVYRSLSPEDNVIMKVMMSRMLKSQTNYGFHELLLNSISRCKANSHMMSVTKFTPT